MLLLSLVCDPRVPAGLCLLPPPQRTGHQTSMAFDQIKVTGLFQHSCAPVRSRLARPGFKSAQAPPSHEPPCLTWKLRPALSLSSWKLWRLSSHCHFSQPKKLASLFCTPSPQIPSQRGRCSPTQPLCAFPCYIKTTPECVTQPGRG